MSLLYSRQRQCFHEDVVAFSDEVAAATRKAGACRQCGLRLDVMSERTSFDHEELAMYRAHWWNQGAKSERRQAERERGQ